MRYSPSIGGHAPGHLRDAFVAAAESWLTSRLTRFGHVEHLQWFWDDALRERLAALSDRDRALWLLGQLWNCTDVLPGLTCEFLGLPSGSTYAQAARVVRRKLN